jgi:hypothetical protein
MASLVLYSGISLKAPTVKIASKRGLVAPTRPTEVRPKAEVRRRRIFNRKSSRSKWDKVKNPYRRPPLSPIKIQNSEFKIQTLAN